MEQETGIIDKVIKLCNIGITDVKIIAKIANTTESAVSNYILLGRRQGKIIENNKVTKYKQVVTLYNLGLKNPETISELIVSSIGSVETYINKGKKEGLIDEKIEANQNRKEVANLCRQRAIELYNSGVTSKAQIAREIGKSINTVRLYLDYGKELGLLKEPKLDEQDIPKKARIEEIADMHNSGKTEEEISQITGLKIGTVKDYMYKGRCAGLINRKKEESYDLEEKEINEKASSKKTKSKKSKTNKAIMITAQRREEVKKLVETMYPIEIAKKLEIRPYDVYNIMDSVPINEMSKINMRAIGNRSNINMQIQELQSEEMMGISEALQEIEKTERSVKNLFELADVYYILGAKISCLRVIDKIGKYTKKEVIKEKAIKQREIYEREFLARKISKSYKKSIQTDGKPIPYENLCKEFNTNSKFLTEILGEEEKDIGDK